MANACLGRDALERVSGVLVSLLVDCLRQIFVDDKVAWQWLHAASALPLSRKGLLGHALPDPIAHFAGRYYLDA